MPTLVTPPRVGPKTLANPQPTGVGKQGAPGGRSPHGGGLWGVSPHKFKRGGEAPTLTNPLRVGPKPLANPQPTGVGSVGGGGTAPSQGVWGMCPQNFQIRGEQLTPVTPPRVEPRTLADPQPTRVGKPGGPRGGAPGRGLWGVSPHETKRGGEAPALTTPPRVGPKTLVNPKPTGVGKGELKRQRNLCPRLRLAIAMSKARGGQDFPCF